MGYSFSNLRCVDNFFGVKSKRESMSIRTCLVHMLVGIGELASTREARERDDGNEGRARAGSDQI